MVDRSQIPAGANETLVVDLRAVADGSLVQEQQPAWASRSADADTQSGAEPEPAGHPVSMEFILPDVPGVYELRCRVHRKPDRLWSRWRRSSDELASVAVPVIVLAARDESPKTSPAGRLAMLHLRSPDWIDRDTTDVAANAQARNFDPRTIATHQAFVAAQRLSDQIEQAGLNGIVLPINREGKRWPQASPAATLTAATLTADRLTVDRLALETVLQVLDRTPLCVLLRLDLSFPLAAIDEAVRESASAEADLVHLRSGEPAGRRYNAFHPLVRRTLVDQVPSVLREFEQHRCVTGVALAVSSSGHLPTTADHAALLDPVLIDQFLQAHPELKIPVSQRRVWGQEEGRPLMAAWIREQLQTLLMELDTAAVGRPLVLIDEWNQQGGDGESAWPVLQQEDFAERTKTLHPTASWLRPPAASLSRYLHRRSSSRHSATASEGGMPDADDPGGIRYVVRLGTAAGTEADFPEIEARRREIRREFAQQVDRLDPAMVLLEPAWFVWQASAPWGEMIRGFTQLPSSRGERREPNDPADQTVGLRLFRSGDGIKVAIANRAPWAVEVELSFAGENAQEKRPNRASKTVTIPADGWTWVESPSGSTDLTGWSARPSAAETSLASIQADVQAVFERLGTLTTLEDYPALSNGDFEHSGDVGLMGWLHAQHPPGAVQIDTAEAYTGKQSIRLRNDPQTSSRAWLVSEAIATPISGRVAVSLACRAASQEGADPHLLRVGVEGIDRNGPFKQAVELEIPRDGDWQPRRVVLEVDGIDPSRIDKLRLTLDSLSSGRIWIDDVHFHDRFATASERSELRSQAYLAVQGLQRAKLTAASQLLQNFWAKKLLSSVDRTAPLLGAEMESAGGQKSSGGIAERIREWFPQPLRF